MNFFVRIFNSTSFRNSLPWITVFIGFFTFSIGIFSKIESQAWKDFLVGTGKTIIAGGVVTVLLKSIQFMGIFKEELTKVIFEPDFLQNRKDLPEYWEKVTKELFKNKFPKINVMITNDVKDIYLPTTYVQYYDNTKQYIEIVLIDKVKQLVQVTQRTTFTIYPVEPKVKFYHDFKNTLLCGDNDEDTDFELLYCSVNGKEQKVSVEKSKSKSSLISTYVVILEGKNEYHLDMNIRKTYSLKFDNMIGHVNKYIKNNFSVQFFLKGVKIEFYPAGTLNNFKTVTDKPDYIEKEYTGVIYPNQGYIAIIKIPE